MKKISISTTFLLLVALTLFPAGPLSAKKLLNKSKLKKLARMLQKMGGDPTLDQLIINEGQVILGVEPSWLIMNGDFKDHHFNLLTDLVVGEYDINPATGLPRYLPSKNAHRDILIEDDSYGGKINIVQKADYENTKIRILLNVSMYGDYGRKGVNRRNYQDFLKGSGKGSGAQKIFLDSLRETLRVWVDEYGIPASRIGVFLDFQELPYWNSQNEELVRFMELVKEKITFEEEPGLIYLRLNPETTTSRPYRLDLIQKLEEKNLVDRYILKAYGLENPNNPLSPTTPRIDSIGKHSLGHMIDHYRVNGVPKDKLIVEFPYFNTVWEKRGGQFWLNQENPYMSIAGAMEIKRQLADTITYYSEDSTFAYFTLDIPGEFKYYLFENELTMRRKYDFLERKEVNGVAVWGVGYNRDVVSRDDLWWAIAKKYSSRPPELGWLGAGFIFFLAFMGFPYSVYQYWEVRNILAKYTKYLMPIGGVAAAFLALYIICVNPSLRGVAALYIAGAILGFFMIQILIRRYIGKLKRYLKLVGIKI